MSDYEHAPELDYVMKKISEQAVHDYLAAHPDFFEEHASLLSSLHLPHAAGGAVSLVERQISVLRQKDIKLEKQLKESDRRCACQRPACCQDSRADHAAVRRP